MSDNVPDQQQLTKTGAAGGHQGHPRHLLEKQEEEEQEEEGVGIRRREKEGAQTHPDRPTARPTRSVDWDASRGAVVSEARAVLRLLSAMG
jgi:hypothetical protein